MWLLTAMQSIPINGLVMVSVPQDLVSMIVTKAINMAKKMDIRVLGVVENMSYIVCPDCSKKIRLFSGESVDAFLKESDLKLLGELPMVSSISNLASQGYENPSENLDGLFGPIVEKILKELGEEK